MKRGLLLIDRGSREQEVIVELEQICNRLKEIGDYEFVEYCFLEVRPPYIKEKMDELIKYNVDSITIIPYFLYPGKKIKASVNEAMKFYHKTNIKLVITRAMSFHPTLIKIVDSRVSDALADNKIKLEKSQIDVLIIGHGSMDPNAHIALKFLKNDLIDSYRNVSYCFLELEEPNIAQGIQLCQENNPQVLVVVFYFLHKGAHVQRDIHEDLNPALANSTLKKTIITKHIGVDHMMVNLMLERCKEVENANS